MTLSKNQITEGADGSVCSFGIDFRHIFTICLHSIFFQILLNARFIESKAYEPYETCY